MGWVGSRVGGGIAVRGVLLPLECCWGLPGLCLGRWAQCGSAVSGVLFWLDGLPHRSIGRSASKQIQIKSRLFAVYVVKHLIVSLLIALDYRVSDGAIKL